MARVLVTGVNGFVGKHLVRELSKRDCRIIGLGQDSKAHPEIADLLDEYWQGDLTNHEAVSRLELDKVDAIISLAGLANVGKSFGNEELYKKINVEILTVLADELLKRGLNPRVIAISTGAVYEPKQPMPLNEESKLLLPADGSPYAQSKIAMEKAAMVLRQKGLDCIIVRPFNHIGPGQEAGFLVPDMQQKLKIAMAAGSPLKMGNLNTRRDYTDVRDVVRTYADLALATKPNHGTYNVCSGKSISGQEILDLLSNAMEAGPVRVEQDPALIRPDDPMEIFGSFKRIESETGWYPTVPLARTIADFVVAT